VSRRKLIGDEAVLAAAMRVIARRGPGAYTLADVAREAGVAPATLIQRFGGKDRLQRRAFVQANEAFANTLARLPQGRSAASAIAVFLVLTSDAPDPQALADQLLWLRLDLRDPELAALAQARSDLLREALAARLPPLPMSASMAARLAEAQWCGALAQWSVERQGPLADYVTESLAAWFSLIARG